MRKLLVAIITLMFVLPCMAKVYGPTKSSDHLWRIAAHVKPSRATAQQTMVAILRENPEAFLARNVNGLKTGYYLRIPTAAYIKKISRQRAVNIVHKQNQAWKKTPTKKIRTSTITKSINYNRKAILRVATMELQNQKDILTLQSQINNITSQINKTNDLISSLESKYQTRLTNIEQNDSVQQANIQKTNQQVQNINTQVQQVQTDTQQQGNIYRYILAAMIAVILLIIILLIILIKRCNKQPDIQKESEQDADYDFMGSDESIPSKLDLARTYIDMGDTNDAKKYLQEVIELGNPEQQQEAKNLLTRIK